MTQLIFKIVPTPLWAEAEVLGQFNGAAIDLQDGYIHLSDATQVEKTAALYFAGQTDLLLVAFDAALFGPELKWEASRGGALFPHVYGTLDPKSMLWAKPLRWLNDKHVFPEGWNT